MSGNSRDTIKNIVTAVQVLWIVLSILLITLIAPLRSEIEELRACLNNLERVEMPDIRKEQVELKTQLREQQIINTNITEVLIEIKEDIKFIRRRSERQ